MGDGDGTSFGGEFPKTGGRKGAGPCGRPRPGKPEPEAKSGKEHTPTRNERQSESEREGEKTREARVSNLPTPNLASVQSDGRTRQTQGGRNQERDQLGVPEHPHQEADQGRGPRREEPWPGTRTRGGGCGRAQEMGERERVA